MISLCMIVKNEEENLKKCLAKIAPFVDEIIIVDTGSTDSSKYIALEYTDKVYCFDWCNDFSTARNFSISKAVNDWILILDADEYVNEFTKDKINNFINCKSNEKIVGRIQRINILEDLNGDKKYIERINRLFNKKYYHYEGMIHEQIVSLSGIPYNTMPVEITANHVGYTKDAVNKTNKLNRNKDLLMKAITEKSNDPYLYYQLGKTNFMMKDYNAACSCFEKALSYPLNSELEYVEDLIETYGYALINDGRYSDAMCIEHYLELYTHSADFRFLLGLIYMNNARFSQAIESFLSCTRLKQYRMEGVTTFLPYYNIGVIYEVLGSKSDAVKYYKLCGSYCLAKERLKRLNQLSE